MVGASPERFLKKTGTFIIGQPMKGTNRRDKDMEIDRMLRRQLMEDPKERAENIMIVDLMRNDLSKTALKGTVKVVELCGVYPFTHWHQMISTVSSRVPDLCNPLDILLSAFPMGSMTGAPKVRALQLIEEYEMTKRGLFSGALGYFSPEGDFDFSVVIRSILYNSLNKYLSFQTGGAITALSVPGKEYQECLLKARGIMSVLHAD
jgi:para-aminobenzoate synthetase component 1